jgi:hypothetical protein
MSTKLATMKAAIEQRHNAALARLEALRKERLDAVQVEAAKFAEEEALLSDAAKDFSALAQKAGKEPHELARILARHFPVTPRIRVVKPRAAKASVVNDSDVKKDGVRRQRTTITPAIEEEVRKLALAGHKAPTIAKAIGISNPTAYAIVKKVCPEHLPVVEGIQNPAPAGAPPAPTAGAGADEKDPVF